MPAMRCFACSADVPLTSGDRVGFRDDCSHCHVDLHVCCNCELHDPDAYNECREPNTERVSDRERANRCEYFSPTGSGSGGSLGGAADTAQKARTALDDLFKK